MVTLVPSAVLQFSDSNGAPLVGGTVDMFTPGTSTPKLTWKDNQALAANTAPIVLDSAGSCIIYGTGSYRQVVKDALGNLIFDDLTTAMLTSTGSLTDLGISAAMVPVVQSPTVAGALDLLTVGGFKHFDMPAGDESLTVHPTANGGATASSFNVQGTTKTELPREFLVNLGLESKTGSTANGDPQAGKVTLYSGLNATAGTGDVWTLNTCLTMGAGSGSYTAQGFELDFNNFNINRGNSGNLNTDFTAPTAVGLSVSGAGSFSSTTALEVVSLAPSGTPPQWNRGLTLIGTMGICGIQEWSIAPVGIQFDGGYTVAALNLTSVYNNAGAITQTAMYMKNSQTLTWQDSTKLAPISDTVDTSNVRILGVGAASVHSSPDFSAPNVRFPNLGAMTWLRTGALVGGSPFCFDYVDLLNNRNVGFNCNSVFMGGGTHPVKNDGSLNLGTSLNYWGSIFSNVGIVAPSDLSLKNSVEPLTGMLALVNAVSPIKFNYNDAVNDKVHYGFDAQEIKDHFQSDFAGLHEQDDGTKWLVKDELIAVMWEAIKELSVKVDRLEHP